MSCRTWRNAGRAMPAAVVCLTLVLAAACTSGGTEPPNRARPSSTHSTTPTPSSTTPSTGSAAPRGAYAPQPERRFIRVGTNNRQQFTDKELRELAKNFDVVLFTKFHAGFDISKAHQAARRLKQLRPDIKVYPYWSTKYWWDKAEKMDLTGFNDDWLLRDNNGKIILRTRHGKVKSKYVDLANPDYRDWALGVLAGWLRAAPYDGISFDAADPIGDYQAKDIKMWDRALGPARVKAYNEGLRDLIRRAHQLVGPGQKVVFNGFSPNPKRGPDRDLGLLKITDGALTERFCLSVRGSVEDVRSTFEILAEHPDKTFFLRSNYRDSFGDRARYERFCFGAFMLAWEPGQSYYQFGESYTDDQLQSPEPDLDVNLGDPTGKARHTGELYQRDFENGTVVVNLGARPATVAARADRNRVSGGRLVAEVAKGQDITVPPHDAVFLLDDGLK